MLKRNPRLGSKVLVKVEPTIEPMNWTEKKYPACASESCQRTERAGSSGPRNVVTTPVSPKAAYVSLARVRSRLEAAKDLLLSGDAEETVFT